MRQELKRQMVRDDRDQTHAW